MTKQKYYDLVAAWANGAEIEMLDKLTGEWRDVINPLWFASLDYRVKPAPKPDIVHEALISLSPFAGPLLYAASPSEANCVLVFDGETGKLKQCTFKGV